MRFIRLSRKHWALTACFAVVAVTVMATAALAANTVTQTSNGNTLTVTIGHSGNTFTCSATNRRSTGVQVDYMLVSVVCQYRDGAGNWHSFETAVANHCNDCANVSKTYTDNPCTSSDGGANLPAGTWRIRGRADGYYINNGVRHDWGDGGALVTTSTYPSASCSS
jgi:hypothetical protein